MSQNNTNDCNTNLTSGFIDLATYDELEKYLYGGPDATSYFVRETRKASWFTQCPVTLSLSNGVPNFGAQWSCTISRAGDYLLGTWLNVTTPLVELDFSHLNGASSNKCIAWTPNFMHALVKECCITFNDLVAAKFDSSHLDFWAAFTIPASKQAGYAEMIGASLPTAGKKLMPQTCNLPLPFFYTRDSGVALPTAALPYNEMRINFTFRDYKDLIVVFEETNGATCAQMQYCSEVDASLGNISSEEPVYKKIPQLTSGAVQVWANYAMVSNEERKRMACAPRDILIEQVQSMTGPNILQKYYKNQPLTQMQTQSLDLRFSHAIKVLFFGMKNITNSTIHSNYTTGIPILKGVMNDVCVVADTTWSREIEEIQASRIAAASKGDREKEETTNLPPSDHVGTLLHKATELNMGKNNNVNGLYMKLDANALLPRCCIMMKCCNAKNPIKRASLIYENTSRIGFMTSDYYTHVQPYYHAPSIPNQYNNTLWCQKGMHMYSYALDFNLVDPNGSTNFGKLTNVHVDLETETDLSLCGQDVDGSAGHAKLVNNLAYTNNHVSMEEEDVGSVLVSARWELIPSSRNVKQATSVTLNYEPVITAVNNNFIRISGGSLGFPVL